MDYMQSPRKPWSAPDILGADHGYALRWKLEETRNWDDNRAKLIKALQS